MADLTIVATGDLHVCDRMALAGLRPADPETGEPLVLADARRTLAWIGEVVRKVDARAVVIAGDIYDRPRPTPAAEAVVAEALAGWIGHDEREVFALLGNHDRTHGTEAHALEPLKSLRPRRLQVLDRPQIASLDTLDEDLETFTARIYALPYPSRAWLAEATDSPEHTNAAVSRRLDRRLGLGLPGPRHRTGTRLGVRREARQHRGIDGIDVIRRGRRSTRHSDHGGRGRLAVFGGACQIRERSVPDGPHVELQRRHQLICR